MEKDFFKAKEISTKLLEVGDVVYMRDQWRDECAQYKVVGFKDGVPFVNKFGDEATGYAWNALNYINTDTVRLVKKGKDV